MKSLDKFRGCLIGGAAGDALGYAVEFLQDEDIFKKYGANGITEYDLVNGVAQISDDTQMTLFTANGLLLGTTRGMTSGIMGSYPSYIALCYKDWLRTQIADEFGFEEPQYSWLNNVPEMNHSRAPGRTCISYLMHDNLGSPTDPRNNSKGCGGVMRVAPIGLYFTDKNIDIYEVDKIGTEAAALTHGHELGYFPAAALVHIIHLISNDDSISLLDAVNDSILAVRRLLAPSEYFSEFAEIMQKAICLSKEDIRILLISDPLFCVFPMARNDYFSFPLHQHLLCKKFVSIVIALKSKKVKAHFDALTVAYIGRVANENYF